MPRRNKSVKYKKTTALGVSCDQKRQYKNKAEAEKTAEYQMLVNPSLELSVYQCNSCFKWHLTRQK
jgi:hypothetical protein